MEDIIIHKGDYWLNSLDRKIHIQEKKKEGKKEPWAILELKACTFLSLVKGQNCALLEKKVSKVPGV